jgi:hypothetical protein
MPSASAGMTDEGKKYTAKKLSKQFHSLLTKFGIAELRDELPSPPTPLPEGEGS